MPLLSFHAFQNRQNLSTVLPSSSPCTPWEVHKKPEELRSTTPSQASPRRSAGTAHRSAPPWCPSKEARSGLHKRPLRAAKQRVLPQETEPRLAAKSLIHRYKKLECKGLRLPASFPSSADASARGLRKSTFKVALQFDKSTLAGLLNLLLGNISVEKWLLFILTPR